jgi:hypothetical protein
MNQKSIKRAMWKVAHKIIWNSQYEFPCSHSFQKTNDDAEAARLIIGKACNKAGTSKEFQETVLLHGKHGKDDLELTKADYDSGLEALKLLMKWDLELKAKNIPNRTSSNSHKIEPDSIWE